MDKTTKIAISVFGVAVFMYLGVVLVGGGDAQAWSVEMLKFGGGAVFVPLLVWLYKEYKDTQDSDNKQSRLEQKLEEVQNESKKAREAGERAEHEQKRQAVR